MLEDWTMDKNSAGRSAQVPSKGNGTECKKSQDAGSTSKSFTRGPHKRETAGPSTPKYDQNRKSQSQKGKAFDKRPRSRRQYLADGKEDPKVDEERAEFGSVLTHGSKKVNLNHLLNFHYMPKDGGSYSHYRPGSAAHGTNRWLYNTQRHKYNKEQYLQANCQFVVKAEGDYTRYLHDPDMLVEWVQIEQIRVQSSELLSCPICLSPPTAARMTRCGHVFCWPCMLHYLALADKSCRKCPICFESVHRDDLKSVIALCHAELSVGEIVSMRLMRRERGTLVAVPVEHVGNAPGPSALSGPVSVAESALNTLYCKLLVATPSQVLAILQREGIELQQRLKEEEHTPEICFTEQALELLGQRQIPLCGMADTSPLSTEKLSEADSQLITNTMIGPEITYQSEFSNAVQEVININNEKIEGVAKDRVRYESISSEGQESVDSQTAATHGTQADLEVITAEDLETPAMLRQATCDAPTSKYFYFYQAADGQHMYLHSLNARMLEAMYGSLEGSPTWLRGRIIEKEAGSMTSELRQRLRYLQHLPVTCQFEVVELEFRPPIVSRDTLLHFQDQLEQRRKKRQRKARDERRHEKRITEEENKLWGRYPTPHIQIESHLQFPEWGLENSPPLSSQYLDIPSQLSQFPPTEALENLNLNSGSAAGPSFAQMLRTGHRDVQPPTRRQPAPQAACSLSDGEPDPDGYVPAPSFSQSFGDAFAQALEQATCAAKESVQDTPEKSSNGRKKKKPKQKVLFSTGMACNSK